MLGSNINDFHDITLDINLGKTEIYLYNRCDDGYKDFYIQAQTYDFLIALMNMLLNCLEIMNDAIQTLETQPQT